MGETAATPLPNVQAGHITNLLLNTLYEGGLANLADVAYELLGNPVYIRDNGHRILAITRKACPTDPFFVQLQESGAFDAETIEGMRKHKRLYADERFTGRAVLINFDKDKPDLLTLPVRVNGITVCFISAVQLGRTFTEEDKDLLDLIAKAVSIELQKDELYKKNLGLMYETFLIELLERSTVGERSAIIANNHLKSIGLQLKDNLFLSVFRFRNEMAPTGKMSMIGRELRHCVPGSVTCGFHGDIVMLSSNDGDDPFTPEQQETLEAFLTNYNLAAVFSQCYTDITRTHLQYSQLIHALDIGMRMRPKKLIHFVQDLLVFQMFRICNSSMHLIDYVPPKMFRLRDYDRQNNTEFFTTLYYYLLNQKNTTATATKLRIHRNTLFYRLSKIQELTAFDLNDEETVFQILLAFKILEYSASETGRDLCFVLPEDK